MSNQEREYRIEGLNTLSFSKVRAGRDEGLRVTKRTWGEFGAEGVLVGALGGWDSP